MPGKGKTKLPDEFRWVKARHSCSPFEVFKILQSECAQDVEDREEVRAATEQVRFKISPHGDRFLVLREGHQINSSIQFEWNSAGITVRDNQSAVMLEATLTLNDDGECRLKVGTEELTFWQFRRRALQGLFFDMSA